MCLLWPPPKKTEVLPVFVIMSSQPNLDQSRIGFWKSLREGGKKGRWGEGREGGWKGGREGLKSVQHEQSMIPQS